MLGVQNKMENGAKKNWFMTNSDVIGFGFGRQIAGRTYNTGSQGSTAIQLLLGMHFMHFFQRIGNKLKWTQAVVQVKKLINNI